MTDRYKFPPMLGPASDQIHGSAEWAECLGNELDYTTERLVDAVKDYRPLIEMLLTASPPPWDVFPQDNPCGTPDAYFRLCTGVSLKTVMDILKNW